MTRKALGLQLASTASQIALNESQANKNNAEAEKIAGGESDKVVDINTVDGFQVISPLIF